jgi:hypothetical protein
MIAYVFMGPSLSLNDARAELDAIYLPPASQGDVYRIGLLRPDAIGIIDGYFDRVPAVWHKELLWAMAQGIHVYGSASMGALRAAELASFGMEGVGQIFEAYRDGLLEDDDEVAVTHEPGETGYRCLSVAMVNIRATIAKAEAAGVIGSETGEALLRLAKGLFYPERAYELLIRLAGEKGLPSRELRDLENWLPQGRVDQKRQDAVAMLCRMKQFAPHSTPKPVTYKVQHTVFWDDLMLQAGGVDAAAINHQFGNVTTDAIVEELRLRGLTYLEAREQGKLRDLALSEARHKGYCTDPGTVHKKLAELRQAHQLNLPGEFDLWLRDNALTSTGLDTLIEEEALVAQVLAQCDRTHKNMQDHLRVKGEYRELRARALDKQRRLEAMGLENPSFEQVEISREEMLHWYFRRQGPFLPPNPEYYARTLGFEHVESFLLAVLREFCYFRAQESDTREKKVHSVDGGS